MNIRESNESVAHIPALDGIRALTVFAVVWYHIWQQSWLSPLIKLQSSGRTILLSLDFFPRTGYLFVDMMLLLSAFCLFLPHARAAVNGSALPSVSVFYKKRIARIVPSYYLAVLILFLYSVFKNAYSGVPEALRDLFATLTFTQTLIPAVYMGSHINGVLWTAAIEMQFYLIFPVLAFAFRKKPVLTYLGMIILGSGYLRLYVLAHEPLMRLTLNQLPGFFSVFANGMASAYLFVYFSGKIRSARLSKAVGWCSCVLFLIAVFLLTRFQHAAAHAQTVQVFQAQYRFLLSLVFSLILLSASFGGPVMRAALGNPVMHFFAAISYNLYIWHQWIAVHLKNVRFPYWEGSALPNMTGNIAWQRSYTWIVLTVSVLFAALVTYLYEKPMNRLIMHADLKRKES